MSSVRRGSVSEREPVFLTQAPPAPKPSPTILLERFRAEHVGDAFDQLLDTASSASSMAFAQLLADEVLTNSPPELQLAVLRGLCSQEHPASLGQALAQTLPMAASSQAWLLVKALGEATPLGRRALADSVSLLFSTLESGELEQVVAAIAPGGKAGFRTDDLIALQRVLHDADAANSSFIRPEVRALTRLPPARWRASLRETFKRFATAVDDSGAVVPNATPDERAMLSALSRYLHARPQLGVWVEGPDLPEEPGGHQSLSVGDPNSGYLGFSFGHDFTGPVSGSSYADTSRPGRIDGERYLAIGPKEALRILWSLIKSEGQEGLYLPPFKTCRSWTQSHFEELVQRLEKTGTGQRRAPPPTPDRVESAGWLWAEPQAYVGVTSSSGRNPRPPLLSSSDTTTRGGTRLMLGFGTEDRFEDDDPGQR